MYKALVGNTRLQKQKQSKKQISKQKQQNKISQILESSLIKFREDSF
jgi:hypothetical protein